MPRPRKNFIDTDMILLAICEQTIQRQVEIETELARLRETDSAQYALRFQPLSREQRRCESTVYSTDGLAGEPLTEAAAKVPFGESHPLNRSTHQENKMSGPV